MTALRDLVRFEPDERLDYPDIKSLQLNSRSDTRASFDALVTGSRATTAKMRILSGFKLEQQTVANSTVKVNGGRILGGEELEDGTFEYGIPYECTGTVNVDLVGLPNATYTIWVRFTHTAGTMANRVFWNGTTEAEDINAIDTRLVAGWDAAAGTVSPGAEYQAVGTVAWAGTTVTTGIIAQGGALFFEGTLAAGVYAAEWGDGGNDRNVDRKTYGVTDLWTMVHAVRRQITEIVGDGQKWYEDFDRISADQFQIEGEETTHKWNVDEFRSRTDVFLGGLAGGDSKLDLNYGSSVTLLAKTSLTLTATTTLAFTGTNASLTTGGVLDVDTKFTIAGGADHYWDADELYHEGDTFFGASGSAHTHSFYGTGGLVIYGTGANVELDDGIEEWVSIPGVELVEYCFGPGNSGLVATANNYLYSTHASTLVEGGTPIRLPHGAWISSLGIYVNTSDTAANAYARIRKYPIGTSGAATTYFASCTYTAGLGTGDKSVVDTSSAGLIVDNANYTYRIDWAIQNNGSSNEMKLFALRLGFKRNKLVMDGAGW